MTKFLIGSNDGKVRSAHVRPLDFSIAGRYVVDVPQDVSVVAGTDSLSALLHEKVKAIKDRPSVKLVPSGGPLSYDISDELLSVPNVDTALSSGCLVGPNKRCSMLKGGFLWTNKLTISTTASYVYLHWYGFRLWMEQGPQPPSSIPVRPDPPRVLYNYDPVAGNFVEFDPADITVEVWSVGSGPGFSPVSKILTARFETIQALALSPGGVRLKFVNNSQSAVWLSDWLLLYNSVA